MEKASGPIAEGRPVAWQMQVGIQVYVSKAKHANSKSHFSRVTFSFVTASPWKLTTFERNVIFQTSIFGIPFWKRDVVTKDNVTLLKGDFLFELFALKL